MRKLFEFIRSIYVVVLFVALEVAAISYYAHSTHYTQARLIAAGHPSAYIDQNEPDLVPLLRGSVWRGDTFL